MLFLIIPCISFGQNNKDFEKLPFDSDTKSIHFYKIISLPSVSKEELSIQVDQTISHINNNGDFNRYTKRYNGFIPRGISQSIPDAITDSVIIKTCMFRIYNASAFGKGTWAKCIVKFFVKNGRIKMDLGDFEKGINQYGSTADKLKNNPKSLDIVNTFNQFAVYIEEYLKLHKTENSNF